MLELHPVNAEFAAALRFNNIMDRALLSYTFIVSKFSKQLKVTGL